MIKSKSAAILVKSKKNNKKSSLKKMTSISALKTSSRRGPQTFQFHLTSCFNQKSTSYNKISKQPSAKGLKTMTEENKRLKREVKQMEKVCSQDKAQICRMIREITEYKTNRITKQKQKEKEPIKSHRGCVKDIQMKLHQIRITRENLQTQREKCGLQQRKNVQLYENLLGQINSVKEMLR